jgi:hypothetical protein
MAWGEVFAVGATEHDMLEGRGLMVVRGLSNTCGGGGGDAAPSHC